MSKKAANSRHNQWVLDAAIACVLLIGGMEVGKADTSIYGANAYGLANIVEINLSHGDSEWVDNLAFETQAIDLDPLTGNIYYFEWRDEANEFAYWDPTTGSNTTVRTYSPAPGVYPKHMAFSPDNTLYVLDNDDQLYTIDKQTGDITVRGQITGLQTGSMGRTGDFVFAPDGTLYLATYQSLYTVDLDTLSATQLYSGLLQEIGGFNVWAGLAYCDGLLYAANIRDSPTRSTMFSIDPLTGAVNRLFPISTFVNDLSSCPASTLHNSPPDLSAIGDKDAAEGEALEIFVDALDPEGHDVTFSVRDLPSGASFTPETQTFSWIPEALDIGDHVVEFVATDNGTPARSDTERITISVSTSASPVSTTVTGEAETEDTTIASQSFASRNFGGSSLDLAVGAGNAVAARGLLKWDLSSIPPGSIVVSAEMRLYSYSDAGPGRITINVHRLLQPWVEGTQTNEDRQLDDPDSVCWIESGSGLGWEEEGASGTSDRDISILTNSTNVGIGWYSWDLTSAVQNWVDGDWTNNGILLQSINENVANLKYFYSSEHEDAGLRPRLAVDYVVAPGENNPPILNPIGNQQVGEQQNLTFTVTASDPDGNNLSLGTDVLPSGATFDSGTGVFSWTPGAGQAGTYDILFTVTDDGVPALSDSEQIAITVNPASGNNPPILNPIGNHAVDEEENLTFTITASDPDDDNLALSADALPPGASLNSGTGVFSWTPSAGQVGSYDILFTVTDDGIPALSDSEQITITVNAPTGNSPPLLDPIGDQAVGEQQSLTFTVTASDPDDDNLAFSTDALPPGSSFDSGTGVFSWTPGAGQAGTYDILFTVTDDGVPALSDSEQITITVNVSGPIAVTLSGESVTSDAMIVSDQYSLFNFGGSPNLYIGSINQAARALIKWELSSIPAGSTIISADMSLYSRVNAAGSQITINAHRVLRPWIEGTMWSADRTQDDPDSACWVEYGSGAPWNEEGAGGSGDRAQDILASATNSGVGWYSWDITSAVQRWVNGDWANDGLILVSSDENQANAKIFVPSEYEDQDLIPELNIVYTSP